MLFLIKPLAFRRHRDLPPCWRRGSPGPGLGLRGHLRTALSCFRFLAGYRMAPGKARSKVHKEAAQVEGAPDGEGRALCCVPQGGCRHVGPCFMSDYLHIGYGAIACAAARISERA